MRFSLDQTLEIISREMPELGLALEPRKDKIQKTLDALSLQKGENYISLGAGRNIFPYIVSMHGLNATIVDIDKEVLVYQREIAETITSYLHEVGGALKLYNFNFDYPRATIPLDGFETSNKKDLNGYFDIVEFSNISSLIGEDDDYLEVADILLDYGKPESRYLISTFGGLTGEKDLTVKAIINIVRGGGGKSEIIDTGLFVSQRFEREEGVVVKVYRPSK